MVGARCGEVSRLREMIQPLAFKGNASADGLLCVIFSPVYGIPDRYFVGSGLRAEIFDHDADRFG